MLMLSEVKRRHRCRRTTFRESTANSMELESRGDKVQESEGERTVLASGPIGISPCVLPACLADCTVRSVYTHTEFCKRVSCFSRWSSHSDAEWLPSPVQKSSS